MSRRQFIVLVECRVIKEVVCENCTEDEAVNDPWTYCVDETERSMRDWDVLDVRGEGE